MSFEKQFIIASIVFILSRHPRVEAHEVPRTSTSTSSFHRLGPHPHLKQRNTIRTVSDRAFGDVEIPGVPLRFSQFPDLLPLEAAFLGEDNEQILGDVLGYEGAQIDDLKTQGVLISKAAPPSAA